MPDDHPVPPGPADDAGQPPDPARSFGSVAEAYHRGRPGYPAKAVTWAVGEEPQVVLEIGAGTGKLTAELVRQGHAVHAIEPDPGMLSVLERTVPGASTKLASAEQLPVNDRSVDVVVVAQAFHWFDHERALPEIARVLRTGGHLAVLWNGRDERIPWVRRLGEVFGAKGPEVGSRQRIDDCGLFEPSTEASFAHWQVIDRESIVDLALSRSYVATLDAEDREAKLAEVVAFYDEYGRGMDGMQLPYRAQCFRAVVRHDDGPDAVAQVEPEADLEAGAPTVSDGTDTDMLLIDFR